MEVPDSSNQGTSNVPGWVIAKIAQFLRDKPHGVIELHAVAGEVLTVKETRTYKRDAGPPLRVGGR